MLSFGDWIVLSVGCQRFWFPVSMWLKVRLVWWDHIMYCTFLSALVILICLWHIHCVVFHVLTNHNLIFILCVCVRSRSFEARMQRQTNKMKTKQEERWEIVFCIIQFSSLTRFQLLPVFVSTNNLKCTRWTNYLQSVLILNSLDTDIWLTAKKFSLFMLFWPVFSAILHIKFLCSLTL